MLKSNYNPDVLTCLANLSNDEVFTPPSLVNQILDLLPMELWSNPDARFLDPVCKSGVFIREMAKRLIVGLEPVFPDLQERANHIYRYQLFGLAITELTGLLSRRSVYCSKVANGRYSVCSDFEDEQGNIVYGRVEHDWRGGKCGFCGASQEVYERGDALESYAYQFIHADDPSCFFKNMKFGIDEYRRAFSKRLFLKTLQRLLPDLTMEDIEPGRAGVRALLLREDGDTRDDFRIEYTKRSIHVLNAPSPAATACLAIGGDILEMAESHFGWTKN